MILRLAVIGAGGHGREALTVASRTGRYDALVAVDDDPSAEDLARLERLGVPLLGGLDALVADPGDHVIAIGDPSVRRTVADHLDTAARATTLVDPSAGIGSDVILDDGVMVFPGAICTTNVRVGRHSHVNCGAIVSHDCRIGAFVSVSPGVRLNGAALVEDGVFLGTGSIVLPGCRIGQDARVGAGAVVRDDVEPGATVAGVPARPVDTARADAAPQADATT